MQSIVIDRWGNPWGTFENAIEAAKWAKAKWPDQEQDEQWMWNACGGGPTGWDIAALWPPRL